MEAADFSALLQAKGIWSPHLTVAFGPICLHVLHAEAGLLAELGPEWLPACLKYYGMDACIAAAWIQTELSDSGNLSWYVFILHSGVREIYITIHIYS